jgi:hypothetical protein
MVRGDVDHARSGAEDLPEPIAREARVHDELADSGLPEVVGIGTLGARRDRE